eukprot:TRINITY_DN20630_c0_g1_i1.p1 TRINITY_DN20630_c0_g1~~TRINITY_DN20630_c0_g1_i1.p1  ORF type:complete len:512 (+),score=74.64 TRINITY_DN20630_c0_g1_i1:45-1580(+)
MSFRLPNMPLLHGHIPLLQESREEVRFPADEVFWDDLKILVSRSPEAREPPRFQLSPDHRPNESIEANRYWVAGYLHKWQVEHPHKVIIRSADETETFCASDEFWSRVQQSLRPGTNAEIVVSRNPGENYGASANEWEGFVRSWEAEKGATPHQRQQQANEATRILEELQGQIVKGDGYTDIPIPHMTLEASLLNDPSLDNPAPVVSPDVNFNKCFRRFVEWMPASQEPPLVDVKLGSGVVTVSKKFFNRFMGAWQRHLPLSITVATRENGNIEVDVFRAHEALWHEIVLRSTEASHQDQQQIPPDVYLASIVDSDVPPRILSKDAYLTVVQMWPDHHPQVHTTSSVPQPVQKKKKLPPAPCVRLPKPDDHKRRRREPGAPSRSSRKASSMPTVTLCLHRDVFEGFNRYSESEVSELTSVREAIQQPKYLTSVPSSGRYGGGSDRSLKQTSRVPTAVPSTPSKSFIVPQLAPSSSRSHRSVSTPSLRSGATTVPSAPTTPPRGPPSSTCSI